MNEKCINFDWLQVWTYEPMWLHSADDYRQAGWVVKERSFGTRIFNEVLTLIDKQGIPFVEICRNPKSKKSQGGIIVDNACSIRVVNQQCYTPNILGELRNFLEQNGFYYKHERLCGIQRIDLAMDFTRFDVLEDTPQKFVNDYMAGMYSKVTQPRVRAVGIDGYSFKRYNSLSWGSTSSMVSTKMYCKTQEMAEVKEKPWIRQAWVDSGILASSLDETPVWRIEFKLTSECNEWVQEDTGLIIHNTIESWSSEDNLMSFFHGLMNHYFDFRIVDTTKSKYKADPVDLWRWPKGVGRFIPRRKEHFRDTGRAELILMNKLDRLKEQATTTTSLNALMQVKDMVKMVYGIKKETHAINLQNGTDNELRLPKMLTPDISIDIVHDIINTCRALSSDSLEKQMSLDVVDATITQLQQTIKQAGERMVLWKSLFPSSRTGVQLSQFVDEYSAKGWFVKECNLLKQRYLEQCEFAQTSLPLLAIWRDLYPAGKVREIELKHARKWYQRNELGAMAEETDEVGR